MQHFKCYGDVRNKDFCVHCGGIYETNDHVPSKVLLDEPYPENLIVCPSCHACNNTLSLDEEYFACLLECVLAGCAEPQKLHRQKITKALTRNDSLLKRLKKARSGNDDAPVWSVEQDRVQAVVLKLARGHAAYEYNEPRLEEPDYINIIPLIAMSEEDRNQFEDTNQGDLAAWPEVGSRAMQRLLIDDSNVYMEGWIVVQDNNYRFFVSQDNGLTVKIVIREYLACHIVWN